MLWILRTTFLTQSVFAFPIIGMITGYQAALIFGVGLPLMFATMMYTSSMLYAAVPLLIVFVFAMRRPPVSSYESRLFAIIRFYTGKRYTAMTPKAGRGSAVLAVPEGPMVTAAADAPQESPRPPMRIMTRPGAMMEVALTLLDVHGAPMPSHKAHVMMDGDILKTTTTTSTGRITVLMDADECVGRRIISVCEATKDGQVGRTLLSRELEFEGNR